MLSYSKIFTGYSSGLFPPVYTNPFVTTYYSFPFQNALSLNFIIQRNSDHLWRNTDRFFYSIIIHFHKICIYIFRNKWLFIWYESKNLILGVERKNKNPQLSKNPTCRLHTLNKNLCCTTFMLKKLNKSSLVDKYYCNSFTVSEQNTEFHIVLQQVPLQHVSQNTTEITADFQPKCQH